MGNAAALSFLRDADVSFIIREIFSKREMEVADVANLARTSRVLNGLVNQMVSRCTRTELRLMVGSFALGKDADKCEKFYHYSEPFETQVPKAGALIWVTGVHIVVPRLCRLVDCVPSLPVSECSGRCLPLVSMYSRNASRTYPRWLSSFQFPYVRTFPILTPGLDVALARMELDDTAKILRRVSSYTINVEEEEEEEEEDDNPRARKRQKVER